MLFVLFQRDQSRKLFHSSGHRGQRLPDLMRNCRRKPPQCGHAILDRYFLLEPAKVRQVLKIEDIAVALRIARSQWRNADSKIALLAIGSAKLNFPAKGQPLVHGRQARKPEVLTDFRELSTPNVSEAMTKDFFSRAVQENNPAVDIGGDQASTHRMDNVFREVLQVEQLFAFLFQLQPLAAQRVHQEACQIGHCKESKKIAEKPEAQYFLGRRSRVGSRNLA